ncbi:MAG: sialate O-acetylesterase [Blastomonas sp.]
MTDINAILRDGNNVNMPALRAYLAALEAALAQANLVIATGTIATLVGDRVYATQSALYADLVPADNLFALVYADADPLKNGLYQKDGATTAGDWDGPFDLFSSAAEALVQGLVDAAEAAALAAAESSAELDDLKAATAGMIADALGAPLGVFPLVAVGVDFSQNTHALIRRAPTDGAVGRIGARLRFVGSGACSVTIARGPDEELTFVSNHALPVVTSTGDFVVDIEDLGDVPVQAGDAVLFTTPSGGVAGYTVAADGEAMLFKVGAFNTGTEIFSVAADTQLDAYVQFVASALQVPRSALVDDELLDHLEVLADVAEPLVGIVGERVDRVGLNPMERGELQFNSNTTALLYTATRDCVIERFEAESNDIGTGGNAGKISLAVGSGSASNPSFASTTALTPATERGPNRWAVDIALSAGQSLYTSTPENGLNLMSTNGVSGASLTFASGPFTSGSKSMTTISGTRLHANVDVRTPGVQVGSADLHPALAAELAGIPLPSEYDMFLVGGQSQGVGSGGGVVATETVPAGVMKQYYSGALTDKTADPVGNASNNSALPAFALEYWRKTGRGVIFVPAASGSTSLVAAADAGSGNWSGTGTLRGAAITLLNAAKAAANSAGLAWKFAGFIWCQGEQDAVAIDATTITKANYTTELGNLLTYLQTETGSGSTMPFIISVTGTQTAGLGGDTTGYQQIRAAQLEFAQGRANVFIGFAAAKTFVARNLMWDGVHYSARGYDEMGRALGNTAAYACAGRA